MLAINLGTNDFSGTLPAAWSKDMPILNDIIVSHCWHISGTLPDRWSTLNAQPRQGSYASLVKAVDNVSKNGVWRIDVADNRISGTVSPG